MPDMKRSPLKSRSSSPARKVEAAADALVQELAIARGRCMSCGGTEGLVGHHLIHRRFKKYRHTARNIFTACWTCHALIHEHPKEFGLWLCRENEKLWRWWRANQVRANQGLGPERSEDD